MRRPVLLSIVIGAVLIAAVDLAVGQQPAPAAVPSRGGVQTFDQPLPEALSPRNASYDITVRLDPVRKEIKGRETIRWRNISAATSNELQFHLYWNAWRNDDSTWLRESRLRAQAPARPRDVVRRPEETGASDVTSIKVTPAGGVAADLTAAIRYLAPDDGNGADRTVMAVTLPDTVGPAATVQIEIEWTGRIPFAAARTGWIGDYFFFGQWFPKIGVLEDGGWNTHQFHNATEFYADFGVYNVQMTVPGGYTLGATGREMRRVDNADGTTTHSYHADDVADFGWTTSPSFVEERRAFNHPKLPSVEMRLLLRPEHRGQETRQFAAAAAALEYYGQWFGAYPYGNITIVDPADQSNSDGMEYPMIFTGRANWLSPASVATPDLTITHETGHQWWYGVVATNEFENGWMDEGFNTWATARVIEETRRSNLMAVRTFGGFIPYALNVPLSREVDGNRMPAYRPDAKSDAQTTPTFRYWPRSANAITYAKTALWMHTLERHLGWPTMQKVMATYFDRWKFRHPRPQDFFQVVNEVSGQDLTSFFDQVVRTSNTFDYAVQELKQEPLSQGRTRAVVVAQRLGEATFPVDVVTTFADGQQATEHWDGKDRRVIYAYERPARVTRVEIDPGQVLLLDINRTNNSRTTQPRAAEAARKWSLAWMVWLQELMITSGIFG
ncbi:MAG TPA: M1 family metallopeptidase [Vicinamibacterales bacterium]|nr:M1 family metallopeptidase [Vicinamibacterales bacterium]